MEADAAALLLREEDGRLSLWFSDDAPGAQRPTHVRAGAGIAGRALATGEPVLVQDPTAGELADPAILDAGISSILALPLDSSGDVIGVIEIGVRSPRRLSLDDVDLLRLTADRVALAIEHARAYGREHRIAVTLQRSLLPQGPLPTVPGAKLSARYLPAAAESEVGGDWFDAIALLGGRILLVMGDVSGKGLAAASTLGALRNAIRAYALDGHAPAEIAERVNRFVLRRAVQRPHGDARAGALRSGLGTADVGQRRAPPAADARHRRCPALPRGRALGAARRAAVSRATRRATPRSRPAAR